MLLQGMTGLLKTAIRRGSRQQITARFPSPPPSRRPERLTRTQRAEGAQLVNGHSLPGSCCPFSVILSVSSRTKLPDSLGTPTCAPAPGAPDSDVQPLLKSSAWTRFGLLKFHNTLHMGLGTAPQTCPAHKLAISQATPAAKAQTDIPPPLLPFSAPHPANQGILSTLCQHTPRSCPLSRPSQATSSQ